MRVIRIRRPNSVFFSDAHPNSESPTYVLEHLATFSVSKENEILYPTDGMRRLLTLEKSNGIWSQKMHFRLDPNVVFIMDYETGVRYDFRVQFFESVPVIAIHIYDRSLWSGFRYP